MTLYKEWEALINNQEESTFRAFWKEYSDAEKTIYADILSHVDRPLTGKIGELAAGYGVRPVMFMGFLDGVQSSLTESFDLTELTEDSEVTLPIDFEKLLFNMHDAGAEHLYGLAEWTNVFDEEKQAAITRAYKDSKTVRRSAPKVGRNDPCPCGSGKKYKHCCMKKDQSL